MGPLVTARASRQGHGLRRQAASRKARSSWSTGAHLKAPGHEKGFFLGAYAVRPRQAGDDDLQGRDLRPGAGRAARRRRSTKRSRSSTAIRTRTAPRSSRARAARRASSSTRSKSAWSASTCRFPCRSRSSPSAAGAARSSATARARDGRRALLHARQGGDDALAGCGCAADGVSHADAGVKLYLTDTSGNSYKVRVLASILGVEYEKVYVTGISASTSRLHSWS